jgi:primosomal protein N' (replication factor Y)
MIYYFIDVILPLPLPGYFTYRLPVELNNFIKKGQRVIVPFGKFKLFSAIVKNIHTNPPKDYEAKYIISILDKEPIINEKQFIFWEWIAEYYMAYLGDVMNAALPSTLKLASETKIVLNQNNEINKDNLNEKEYLIVEALERQHYLTISDISKILDIQKVFPIVKTLFEKNIIILEEELKNNYKPKKEAYINLAAQYTSDKQLSQLFDLLEKKAPKQIEILMEFISMSNKRKLKNQSLSLNELLKDNKTRREQINTLIKKGIFEITYKYHSRLKDVEDTINNMPELSHNQSIALNEIKENFKNKDVVLLHGVTSSGKTEIYIRLINEFIQQGKQVLYLLPEIALTTQTINRLQKYFGNKVGVYHSKFNDNEKIEIWNKVLNNNLLKLNNENVPYQIILGARSSIFLPFINLGLIIVDEEHDTSYKQTEHAPRYNARDAAIFLAKIYNAKTLLGSATPSMESYYNTKINKYALVNISERYGNVEMPEHVIVNIKNDTLQRKMKSHFSPLLINEITNSLQKKEQIILFQNRRGFAPRIICNECNWTLMCKNCDVTLTYHKQHNTFKCHYCGYVTPPPEKCPVCGNNNLQMKGFGTEKIEEELPIFFPNAKIARMDLDTTRTKYAFQKLINDIEEGNIDILVGTQMITKGLDFENIALVCILNADNMLSFPDFRAFEHSFQLMAQVSGRAGRKNKRGKVIIQTFSPQHPVFQYVINNDYNSMYDNEIIHRQKFKYPPFYRLIEITLKNKDMQLLNKVANKFALLLQQSLENNILGPEYPIIPKIRNEYLKNIIIKINKNYPQSKTKLKLINLINEFKTIKEHKSTKIIINVDP